MDILSRPWFRRIWVLQEVSAARQIIIKCGKAEIDGFAFSTGLMALTLADRQSYSDLEVSAIAVLRLIRKAIFQSSYDEEVTSSTELSLSIGSLG